MMNTLTYSLFSNYVYYSNNGLYRKLFSCYRDHISHAVVLSEVFDFIPIIAFYIFQIISVLLNSVHIYLYTQPTASHF